MAKAPQQLFVLIMFQQIVGAETRVLQAAGANAVKSAITIPKAKLCSLFSFRFSEPVVWRYLAVASSAAVIILPDPDPDPDAVNLTLPDPKRR